MVQLQNIQKAHDELSVLIQDSKATKENKLEEMKEELRTLQNKNKENIMLLIEQVNSDEMGNPETKCSTALKELNKFKADIDKFK